MKRFILIISIIFISLSGFSQEVVSKDSTNILSEKIYNDVKQAKLEAEAEGKRKSALAEAEGFKATMEAAKGNETLAIHYKMVTQYKEIAGEQVKAFEKMNLGNINIFDTGDGKGAGKFMKDIVNTVAPATSVLSEMPVIGKAVKALESALDKKNESENGEGDVKSSAFEEVK